MELFTNVIVEFFFALSVVNFIFGTAFLSVFTWRSANAMLVRPIAVTTTDSVSKKLKLRAVSMRQREMR
jgi:hypothetical protein